MSSTPTLKCILLDTGYCLAWEHHMIRGGAHRRVACHSLVALLHHPQQGWLLWDTGYAPRMLDATAHFPFSLYRKATPLILKPELAVAAQLQRWNLQVGDIQHIILSHFHADHIAGLQDFPAARLIASEEAYAGVAGRRGVQALRKAFIPELLPTDFEQRVTLLPAFRGNAMPELGASHDLFGDGSLLLFSLPGHAQGQLGLLAQTERGQIFFAADSCWLRRAIYEQRPPSHMTHFFIDNAHAMQTTLKRLHTFSQEHPDIIIIPSHCPEAYAQEVAPGL